jgi:N-methylhydantoinase A
MSFIIGIDTGGTFTDFIFISNGEVIVHKVLSTPDNPARAILEGLSAMVKESEAVSVTYGTTVATNALLERKGARVAFITTKGFEDLIEIGRQNRPELYTLEPQKPIPLVPRSLRIGVAERILASGQVLNPLSRREILRVKRWIRKKAIDSLAVGFLHSYRNPTHERTVARELKSLGLPISLSHRILPEYREYERFSTTAVNAYVTPVIAHHMMELHRALKRNVVRLKSSIRVMQSNGGAMTLRGASEHPVRTLLSGPAGGVVAAHELAKRSGVKKMISLDMGGTSTDVCLVNGEIPLTPEKLVAGVPVKVPMVDIYTVGAGGGSISRLDAGGALKVGPESAGADPGPVCYGRGNEMTVTDANLILGRLNQDRFLGGRMQLDLVRTAKKMKEFARTVKLMPLATAWGIIQVVNSNMERAIRVVSLERGLDPREFSLVAFGGAGGLHAAELAEGLGMSHVVIPLRPGLLSAWGMAVSPLVKDFSLSVLELNAEFERINKKLSALAGRGLKETVREGLKKNESRVLLSVDMRYAGQAYEINLPWDRSFTRRFHQLHEARFGHSDPSKEVEVVTLRVRIEGKGRLKKPRSVSLKRGSGKQGFLGQREVYFDKRLLRCPTYERERLNPGDRIHGPAVIYEFSSTVVVPPVWQARVDRYSNLDLLRN